MQVEATPHRAVAAAVAFHRVPLLALAAALTVALFALTGNDIPFPASSYSALYLFPVNVASLVLLRWLVHREGGRLRDLIGFSRERLGRDILWGLLWLMVLFVPFALAIMGTMFALYGGTAFTQFEAVFAPPADSIPALPFGVSLTLAILVVATFVPLNAPTEELVYRGYAQRRFGMPTWLAIGLPAVGFGIQHMFFSPTVPGMLVYGVAFFAWSVIGGLIYARQRRLMPLIVAHLLVNLFTSAPALLIPFLVAT
jgi:membrane protease YdiL (CAAX protease family)